MTSDDAERHRYFALRHRSASAGIAGGTTTHEARPPTAPASTMAPDQSGSDHQTPRGSATPAKKTAKETAGRANAPRRRARTSAGGRRHRRTRTTATET